MNKLIKHSTIMEQIAKKIFYNFEFEWENLSRFYLALHTSPLKSGDDQRINECSYNNYKRQLILRKDTDWKIINDTVTNNVKIIFPTCIGGLETATHFSIGTAETGEGMIIYPGVLRNKINLFLNVKIEFDVGSLVIKYITI